MKIKLLYKLLAINAFVIIATVIGISLGLRHYSIALIEQNRMMAYNNFLTFKQTTEQYLLYTSLTIIPISIIFGWIVTRAIVRPLTKMRGLLKEIGRGNYLVQLNVRSKDEIGDLAKSFNEMSKELERIERLRRNLVADVAHELRTPLSTICGYIEALKDGILPASPQVLEKSYAEVQRLVRLVEDLHQLTLIEGEYRDENWHETIDVGKCALEVAEDFLPRWKEKSIKFQMGSLEKSLSVTMKKSRFFQLFVNLFDNTVRYTPSGESVHLEIKTQKEHVYIHLTNTGIEIPAESLTLIFERFYRIDQSRSRELGGGSGIGLAIVSDIIKRSNGKIWATSENQQTTFHILLPLSKRFKFN
ncbi:ATP-binding protein [Neobacillus niacini]|uniref:sensor histidine kinase n=1 Tax=Neobacillus niacini TaxID=86668 RepID=UPI00285A412E|nr:ATP-binding protein [Neobacillus niacini]MDR6998640.1 signal transduction histidine kinase [Neobacillus niacini]